jgi:hypothetical protein
VNAGNVLRKKRLKQKLRSKYLRTMRKKKKNSVRNVSNDLKKWMRRMEFVGSVWGNLSN